MKPKYREINKNISALISFSNHKILYIYCKKWKNKNISEFVNEVLYEFLFETKEGKSLRKRANRTLKNKINLTEDIYKIK